MNLTHTLTRSRTCEAIARPEVHAPHAFGEYELVDSACGKAKEEREQSEEGGGVCG